MLCSSDAVGNVVVCHSLYVRMVQKVLNLTDAYIGLGEHGDLGCHFANVKYREDRDAEGVEWCGERRGDILLTTD